MKKFFIVNTEPNCNILGLDPIIHAFWDEKMEKLTGRRLTVFAYQIANGVMNAIPDKEEWFGFGAFLFNKMVVEPDFYKQVHNQLVENGSKLYDLCQQVLSQTNSDQSEIKKNFLEIRKLFTAICVPGLVAPLVEMSSGGVSKKVEDILRSRDLTAHNLVLSETTSVLVAPNESTWNEEFRDALYLSAQKIYEDKNNESLIGDFIANTA